MSESDAYSGGVDGITVVGRVQLQFCVHAVESLCPAPTSPLPPFTHLEYDVVAAGKLLLSLHAVMDWERDGRGAFGEIEHAAPATSFVATAATTPHQPQAVLPPLPPRHVLGF